MTKKTNVRLDENELYVIIHALKSLDEEAECYLSGEHTSPYWIKERLESILENMG